MTVVEEVVIPATKFAVAMDHIKNNRLEYLVLLVLSHLAGLTSSAYTYASGVCA